MRIEYMNDKSTKMKWMHFTENIYLCSRIALHKKMKCYIILTVIWQIEKIIYNWIRIVELNQIVIISLTMFSTGQYGHCLTTLGDHFTKVD